MTAELYGVSWFKSSYSSGQTACVEAAWLRNDRIGVRDSKNPAGPALVFASDVWGSFTAALRREPFGRQP